MTEDLQKKVDRAIRFIQSIPQDGTIELAYSTGKDSDVILELAKMAGIPFEAIYKNTTCDQPGSIAHAREMGVKIVQPKMNLLQLIEKKGWPTRFRRFCCEVLKEYKIHDRVILGIRREESIARAKRYTEPEQCRVYSSKEKVRQYLPILDWTNEDVAQFVRERELRCHPHYYDEQGNFHVERRVGCIGCPMATGNGVEDYKHFPAVFRARAKAYFRFCQKHGLKKFPSPYHSLYQDLFCKTMAEYNLQVSGMFGDIGEDEMREWLENYFKIKLN